MQLLLKNARRKHNDSFKSEVVLEALKLSKTLAELALEYKFSSTWKPEFLSNAHLIFGAKRKKEVASYNNITDNLFNQIGRLRMENEWLKKS